MLGYDINYIKTFCAGCGYELILPDDRAYRLPDGKIYCSTCVDNMRVEEDGYDEYDFYGEDERFEDEAV